LKDTSGSSTGPAYADLADEYLPAIALVDQLNASKAQGLFASNVGGEITGKPYATRSTRAGEGAGDRVRVSCKRIRGRNLIVELTIGLAGEIGDEPSLAKLIAGPRRPIPAAPAARSIW
jgi:ribonuclease T2